MFNLLTPEQRAIGRRTFLKAAGTLPAMPVVARENTTQKKVRAAIIGTGAQGQVLIEQCNPEYFDFRAVCDIRPSNRSRALHLAQTILNKDAKAYSDYKEVINRDDIDAVLIATPLWMHAPVALDALKAGKHVFCEKTMAFTLNECKQMVQLARANQLNLQVGHQRFYNPIYHQAFRMVIEGMIGGIYHIRAAWHRNNNWRREIPDEDQKAVDEGILNPADFGYDSLEELVNWRLYKDYSGGLSTELMSHQISITNWLFGEAPKQVSATGGIYRFKDDPRDVADHIYCTFEYPSGPVVTYSSIQSNDFENFYEQIFGTEGTLIISGEINSYLFLNKELPQADQAPTEQGMAEDDENSTTLKASASRAKDARGGSHSGGTAQTGFGVLVPYKTELEGFANTILFNAPNLCDGQTGLEAAACSLFANEAMTSGTRIPIANQLLS